MLTALAGRRHEVTTAYRIRAANARLDRAVTTVVAFRALRPVELDAYVACGRVARERRADTPCRGSRARSSPSCAARTPTSSGCPLAEVLADLQALEALPRYPPPGFGSAASRRAVTRAEAIAAGLARVHARIAAAEQAAGRPPGSVRLLAVSKKMPPDDVRAALAAGQRAFGENYAQELRDKRALSPRSALPAPPEWHFIGPLQSNKVKYVAGQVALIHSIDSAALLDAIEARGVPQACLVQVNVAGEAQKTRRRPRRRCPALLDRVRGAAHTLRCAGLMLIPPLRRPRRRPALRRPARAARSRSARPPPQRRPHASCRWG